MLSHFFIDRPIFATVLSVVIVIVGGVAYIGLPIAQYPEVAPPVVQVSATYPGANAKTVADIVAIPIEQEVNGVERMLYMSSRSTNDGQLLLDVTFEVGTNLDMAQVLVQNRVAIAEAKLPDEVKRLGVTTKKKSPAILMCVNLISPDQRYDQLYLSNFALREIKDELARVKGVGDVSFLGPRDYSLRIWLDPEKLAAKKLTAGDVVKAVSEQNTQVAAGRLGQPPTPADTALNFQLTINTQGRLVDEEEFGKIIVKSGEQGQNVFLRNLVRDSKYDVEGTAIEKGIELGAKNYDVNSYLDGKPAVTMAVFQLPGSNALKTAEAIKAKMTTLSTKFPEGVDYKIYYDTTVFIDESIHEVFKTLIEAFILVFIVVLAVPARLARDDRADDRRPGLADRHDGGDGDAGLFAQQSVVVRLGAGHRDRRRRCDRGRGKRRALFGDGLRCPRSGPKGDDRSRRARHRHRAGAHGRVRAHGVHGRDQRRVFQAVRADHRGVDHYFGVQFA